MPRKIYCQMFDRVWSMSRTRYMDLLKEVADTGCIKDMCAYGPMLSCRTSQKYINDWSISVINVLDMPKEHAAWELEYMQSEIK